MRPCATAPGEGLGRPKVGPDGRLRGIVSRRRRASAAFPGSVPAPRRGPKPSKNKILQILSRGSNPRPMAHKTIALTTELRELLGVILGLGLVHRRARPFFGLAAAGATPNAFLPSPRIGSGETAESSAAQAMVREPSDLPQDAGAVSRTALRARGGAVRFRARRARAAKLRAVVSCHSSP